MNRCLVGLFAPLACMLVVAAAAALRAAPMDDERTQAFQWFSELGFPDVKDAPLVHVATGHWYQSGGDEPQNQYVYGFLLKEDGDAFEVLTLGRVVMQKVKTPDGTPAHEQVSYEKLELKKFVAETVAAQRETEKLSDSDRFRRRAFRRGTDQLDLFTLAWGCWRQGHAELAQQLYDLAAESGEPNNEQRLSLRQSLAKELALLEIWDCVRGFGDADIPRTTLLARFKRFLKNFPGSEHEKLAQETVTLLEQMVAEDEQHAKERAAGKPFDELPTPDKVAELIFQLRDQNGQQWSQPGACDIFLTAKGGETSPAHQLLAMGYDAVPGLIEALDDKRFTRSVGFHRNFYFSHHVLRVGDAAEQILMRIAGRGFYERTHTNGAMLKDGAAPTVKEQVAAWWKEVQQKGERQWLIESVARGDEHSASLADRLVRKYPRDALAALNKGISAAQDGYVRSSLVGELANLPGDGPVPTLLNELEHGPSVSTRIAAARALHERKRPEAVEAMIREWEQPRPRPKRGGDPFGDREEFWGGGMQGVVEFLANSGNLRAVLSLAKNAHKHPVDLRLTLVEQFDERAMEAAPPETRAAILTLLEAALDDTEPRRGMSGSRGGKSYSDPRICDMAGYMLNDIDAEKYSFDLGAPYAQRERERLALKNVFRRQRGEEPLLPRPPRKITPVEAAALAPLVEKYLVAEGDAQQAAGAEIAKLGLGALAPLQERIESLEKDSPRRKALEQLAGRLAATVVEIQIAKRSLRPDIATQARLDKLLHQPLEATAFVELLSGITKTFPGETCGVELSVTSALDGPGLVIAIDLLDAERAETPPKTDSEPQQWNFDQCASAGRRRFTNSSGSSSSGDFASGDEWPEAVRAALAASATASVEISTRVTGQWPEAAPK